eukprot:TRINITY_DN26807_c0_g1_i1.p1 TRINITY_DN26807_c0_g1~~TRINITY_DN26807_c0_g1_i1.p1  ORF type:complete len:309 (+),score=35.24 TRINITY_DN26807_c0_g1_i1:123-1049(+)
MGLTMIQVPKAAVEYGGDGKGFEVRYQLKCMSSTHSWCVEKSYSQCKELHRRCLETVCPWSKKGFIFQTVAWMARSRDTLPHFPSVSAPMVHTNGSKRRIEARRQKIEQYFTALVEGEHCVYERDFKVREIINKFVESKEDATILRNSDLPKTKRVYKTLWLERRPPVPETAGGNLVIMLPKASVEAGSDGLVYQLKSEWGDTRSKLRGKYLQLRDFHTWMDTLGDMVPTIQMAANHLSRATRAPPVTKPPPHASPTWLPPKHSTVNSDGSLSPLPGCKCTPHLTCLLPYAVNHYETYTDYAIQITPP